MSYSYRANPALAASSFEATKVVSQDDRSERRPRAKPLLRRYEAAYLNAAGETTQFSRIAPAVPMFEGAFNAIARSTLITTTNGPVAVEDLQPGDLIETAETGPEPLLWIGNLMFYPLRDDQPLRTDPLVRLTADAMGFGRPMQDLLLGTGARVWSRRDNDFVEPSALADGESIFELAPVAPITVYHLCLSGPRTILANGVALQTYQPDPTLLRNLTPEMRALFLSLFPNAAVLNGFGIMRGRAAPAQTRAA
ncbi:MAG: Hint domain-containing protein [Paracoccaceae bacterium]|nr:Hint domain-containing protein [Paracoccaceae bacterium]